MRAAYGVQEEEEDDKMIYRNIVNGYKTEQNNMIISY